MTTRVNGRNLRRRITHAGGVLSALVACLITVSNVQAAPIGLASLAPDITASLNLSYGGGVFSGVLTDGVGQYTPGGVAITDLTYTFSSAIDSSGVLSSGNFSIFGEVPTLGIGPAVLLAGNLTAFGWLFDATSPGFGLFEFLFDVTSSAPGLGFGTSGGIIITSFDLTGGGFGDAFNGSGTSDSFSRAVPEPAMLAFFALGSVGLAARRRYLARRNR
jgi:hypothetical protein